MSAETHVRYLDAPVRRLLSIVPLMYGDLWTGAKGFYKVEPRPWSSSGPARTSTGCADRSQAPPVSRPGDRGGPPGIVSCAG